MSFRLQGKRGRTWQADDREVMALACAHRLSACDESFLALAVREGCALANLGRRLNLNAAAASEGLPPFA